MKMCIIGHFQQKYGIKIQSINSHKGFSIMSELSSAWVNYDSDYFDTLCLIFIVTRLGVFTLVLAIFIVSFYVLFNHGTCTG